MDCDKRMDVRDSTVQNDGILGRMKLERAPQELQTCGTSKATNTESGLFECCKEGFRRKDRSVEFL